MVRTVPGLGANPPSPGKVVMNLLKLFNVTYVTVYENRCVGNIYAARRDESGRRAMVSRV